MKLLFLVPAFYFYRSRLSKGSIAFHVVFEWVAALLLVLLFPTGSIYDSIFGAFLAYISFISVYELGYLMNDYYSFSREINGRDRRETELGPVWIGAMIISRAVVFLSISCFWPIAEGAEWWSFFCALIFIFTLHNLLRDQELKVLTFTWLSWLRFMAPVIFVVQSDQLMGIGLGAALGYVGFRVLAYLDSKDMLNMDGRKRARFRGAFFLSLVTGIIVLWPYSDASGYVVLATYYAVASVLGLSLSIYLHQAKRKFHKHT
jgi:hypothetical protein